MNGLIDWLKQQTQYGNAFLWILHLLTLFPSVTLWTFLKMIHCSIHITLISKDWNTNILLFLILIWFVKHSCFILNYNWNMQDIRRIHNWLVSEFKIIKSIFLCFKTCKNQLLSKIISWHKMLLSFCIVFWLFIEYIFVRLFLIVL